MTSPNRDQGGARWSAEGAPQQPAPQHPVNPGPQPPWADGVPALPYGPPWNGSADPLQPEPPAYRKRPALAAVLGLATAVVVAGLGAPLGWLWSVVAPDVPVQMTADGPILADPEPEQFIAADGWFTALGLAFGLIVAVVVWYGLRRLRGPAGLFAITLGAVGAALLAWYVGRHVGLAEYHRLARAAPVGSRFGKPPDLRAEELKLVFGFLPLIRGALLVPAFAAAATYTMMAGWSRYMTLRAETEPVPVSWDSAGWPAPTAAPESPESGEAGPPRG